MKTTTLIAFAMSTSMSFAGPSSAKSPNPAIIPAAAIPSSSGCPQCLAFSGLFVGAGVDYLFDAEAVYYTGRLGYELGSGSGLYSQSLFLEAGWLESQELGLGDLSAVPITLNYEYKRAITRCLNFYIGGGLGVVITSDDGTTTKGKVAGVTSDVDEEDVVLFGQVFAGLTYCITENVEAYGGVRYLWSDDINDGDGFNDWSIGAGLRVKF